MSEWRGRRIPLAVRHAVLARDGLFCRHCGVSVKRRGSGPYSPTELHFDHVLHFAAGGLHTVDNLVVSCATCNLRRPNSGISLKLRPGDEWVVRTARGYWWRDPAYQPPRLLELAGFDLASVAPTHEELSVYLRRIVAGRLAATPPGEPICIEAAA